jgi:hypothetical protein
MNQKIENNKMAEERVNQKKTKLDIIEQNLQRTVQACKEKQNEYDKRNRIKTTINQKINRCEEEKIETDKKIEKAQNKWSMENTKIRRNAGELHRIEMTLKTCNRNPHFVEIHNQQELNDIHNQQELNDIHNQRELNDIHNQQELNDIHNQQELNDFHNLNIKETVENKQQIQQRLKQQPILLRRGSLMI